MPRKTRWEMVRRTAAALFAANGYAAASLSELARVSRLSKPGIYYHVRDKEELLFRICESTMAALLAGGRAAAAGDGDPVARLRRIMRAHATHYWRNSADLVILFGQMRYLSPPRQQRIVALERAYLELVRSIIRDGQRRRLFRPLDPTAAAFSLFAMLNTLDGWYDRKGRLGPDRLVVELERLYLGGLAAPPRRRDRRRPDIEPKRSRRPT
jgi:AcrR family transcriptional regulator